jgi:hypothetical protein
VPLKKQLFTHEIILLNGFVKKSTADYEKQIAIAIKLMEEFL